MNERTLRPGNVAAAAVALGGILIVVQPEHAVSILQLMLVTVAGAAGLYALVVSAPTTWWTSPFDSAAAEEHGAQGAGELDRIRARLGGRRQPVGRAPPMPAEALYMLRPLIEAALERRGLDPGDDADRERARDLLSPRTFAILASDPWKRPPWFRMRRPDERQVAELVHGVLDELDLLVAYGRSPAPFDPHHPRGT